MEWWHYLIIVVLATVSFGCLAFVVESARKQYWTNVYESEERIANRIKWSSPFPGCYVRQDTPKRVPLDREFIEEITKGASPEYKASVERIAKEHNERYGFKE